MSTTDVERLREGLRRLAGQAVDEIHIDRIEADARARSVQVARQRLRLAPVDRRLHLRREVLHAHRQPVEPETAQQVELAARCHARVDFDRTLGVSIEPKMTSEGLVEACDLRRY